MPVRPSSARDLFESELSFPASAAAVSAAVGDTELVAAGGESVTIGTVIERSETSEYETAAELHDTLLANLGEEYVGRTEYDDRSSNPVRDDQESL